MDSLLNFIIGVELTTVGAGAMGLWMLSQEGLNAGKLGVIPAVSQLMPKGLGR